MRPAAENTRSTPAVEAGAARYCLLGHLSELGEAVLVVLPPVEQDDVGVLERHCQVLLELGIAKYSSSSSTSGFALCPADFAFCLIVRHATAVHAAVAYSKITPQREYMKKEEY